MNSDFGYDPFDISFSTIDDELFILLSSKFDEFKEKNKAYIELYSQIMQNKRVISKNERTSLGIN